MWKGEKYLLYIGMIGTNLGQIWDESKGCCQRRWVYISNFKVPMKSGFVGSSAALSNLWLQL